MFWTTVCYLTAAFTVLFGSSDGSACLNSKTFGDVLNAWLGVIVGVAVFHIVFSNVALSRLEGHTFRSELRAAKAILAGMCDTVVEIDSEFINLRLTAVVFCRMERGLIVVVRQPRAHRSPWRGWAGP